MTEVPKGRLTTPAVEASPGERNEPPLVSVVVLSYNRPGLLRQSLASIFGQTYPHLEVIVVDNRSERSDEVARVVAEYPSIHFIRNACNRGFTGGMNQGIQAASGVYVYLTEDDVVTEAHSIASLVEHSHQHPAPGLLTGIIYQSRAGKICCAGGELDLRRLHPAVRFLAEGELDVGQYPDAFRTSFVVGAMVFARADYLKWLKGFREDFFMYVEDVELCARVLGLGHSLTVVPSAKLYPTDPPALHQGDPGPLVRYHSTKNTVALYLLHAPPAVALRTVCQSFGSSLVRDYLRIPNNFRPRLRACGWLAWNLPRLLYDRWTWRRRLTARAMGSAT